MAVHGSSIECASAWYADGRGFNPHFLQHSFVEFGHELLPTAILSLALIQEVQLSVTGKRMCTKYSVDRLADHARNYLKCVEGL